MMMMKIARCRIWQVVLALCVHACCGGDEIPTIISKEELDAQNVRTIYLLPLHS